MESILLEPLTADMEQEAVEVYANVFAGPDWFEISKCRSCGRAYPGPIDSRPTPEADYQTGQPCWGCQEPLELIDFYRDPDDRLGSRIFADAVARPGFVGFVARDSNGRLVGFAAGYPVPEEDTPAVKFSKVRESLAQKGYQSDQCFYAAEIGVVPEARVHGVGTKLAMARFSSARASGFRYVCFRTIDKLRLLGLYGKLFGPENLVELFPDPDPVKSQVWYLVPLEKLGETV